eukprot:scaffold44145_cov54-Phaeocystis_antarctica.AAC.2
MHMRPPSLWSIYVRAGGGPLVRAAAPRPAQLDHPAELAAGAHAGGAHGIPRGRVRRAQPRTRRPATPCIRGRNPWSRRCNPVVLKAATLWLAGATRAASRKSPCLRASSSDSLPSSRALEHRSDPRLTRALRGPAPPLHLRPLALSPPRNA